MLQCATIVFSRRFSVFRELNTAQAEIVSGASGVFIPMSVWKLTHTDDKLASGGRLH